jgi:hypothetical protein
MRNFIEIIVKIRLEGYYPALSVQTFLYLRPEK